MVREESLSNVILELHYGLGLVGQDLLCLNEQIKSKSLQGIRYKNEIQEMLHCVCFLVIIFYVFVFYCKIREGFPMFYLEFWKHVGFR